MRYVDITSTITPQEFEKSELYEEFLSRKNPYEGTVFEVFTKMSSRTKGSYFEKIFDSYMQRKGYKKIPNFSADHDRVFLVDARIIKFEVKGSMLWGSTNTLRWQQIRDQDYGVIIFMSILPSGIVIHGCTKQAVMDFVETQDDEGYWPYNQHGGKTKRSGTFFLHGTPKDFPFMKPIEELF